MTTTFLKRQKEMKRQAKRREKAERRMQKKLAKREEKEAIEDTGPAGTSVMNGACEDATQPDPE